MVRKSDVTLNSNNLTLRGGEHTKVINVPKLQNKQFVISISCHVFPGAPFWAEASAYGQPHDRQNLYRTVTLLNKCLSNSAHVKLRSEVS